MVNQKILRHFILSSKNIRLSFLNKKKVVTWSLYRGTKGILFLWALVYCKIIPDCYEYGL